jgi:hypothetical protein
MPHIIRLRGPWEEQPLEGGRVCLVRRFHRPTGLEAGDRVWLVIGEVSAPAEVTLGGKLLGRIAQAQPPAPQTSTARFDITAELAPLNVLEIRLPAPPRLEGVRLEIAAATSSDQT